MTASTAAAVLSAQDTKSCSMFQLDPVNRDREGFLAMYDQDDSTGPREEYELVQEVASRTILHWNYRRLKELPPELISIKKNVHR